MNPDYDDGYYAGYNQGFSDGYHKTDFPEDEIYELLLDHMSGFYQDSTAFLREVKKLWEAQHDSSS